MSCTTHIPEYDASVNETYCQVCLERLPNAPPAEINPRLPRVTRTGVAVLMLGLLVLYIWYPSQRDPTPRSQTPCWDLNELTARIEAEHAELELELGERPCTTSGRFLFQVGLEE